MRKVYPKLIPADLVSVQPMTGNWKRRKEELIQKVSNPEVTAADLSKQEKEDLGHILEGTEGEAFDSSIFYINYKYNKDEDS